MQSVRHSKESMENWLQTFHGLIQTLNIDIQIEKV